MKTERWCTTVGPAKGGVSGQMPDHRQTRHSDSAPPPPLPAASSQLSLQINTMRSSLQQRHAAMWNRQLIEPHNP